MFGRIFGNPRIIVDENPEREVERYLRNRYRKDIEEKAERISPRLGKVVRTTNNLNDTLENAQDSWNIANVITRLCSKEVKELNLADHLFVQRVGYTHHGMYIGNGEVIHYLKDCVSIDSLETFADGAKIHKKSDYESRLSYSADEAVRRGYSRLGEDEYNLFKNNCENFVRWCRNGGEEY